MAETLKSLDSNRSALVENEKLSSSSTNKDTDRPDKQIKSVAVAKSVKEGVWNEHLCNCFRNMLSCYCVFAVPWGAACVQSVAVDTATGDGNACSFLRNVC